MKQLVFMLGALSLAVAAKAGTITITFEFNNPTGALGTTETYTQGIYSIVASGFNGTDSPQDLFSKNAGGDEVGIGLTNDSDFEITPGSFIQLDLSTLPLGTFALQINSDTGADAFKLYNTSVAGTLGGVVLDSQGSTSNPLLTITPSLRYLDLTATSGNVLEGPLSFTVSTTPEPATFLMIAVGLVSVGLLGRRFAAVRT